ncbi:YggS family pyridoxal phosphate-dependent enzyme [bacterium]|nr:YggS family pyridoxal phosphate-dependent enzyme [bacterium]
MDIAENVKKILNDIPTNIEALAAVKTRSCPEINQALNAGITIIGQNYVQDAQRTLDCLKYPYKFHFIGHLQRNKVKYIIDKVDMIETVDNIKLANIINLQSEKYNKISNILIEINSGNEPQKNGVMPENIIDFIKSLEELSNIKIWGLMTMAPYFEDPERMRPYFKLAKELFEATKEIEQQNYKANILSMGMSDSYKIAIEEGANLVRIGTKIFGPRK